MNLIRMKALAFYLHRMRIFVEIISRHRVTDAAHMNTDLMCSPGEYSYFYQSKIAVLLDDGILGNRFLSRIRDFMLHDAVGFSSDRVCNPTVTLV